MDAHDMGTWPPTRRKSHCRYGRMFDFDQKALVLTSNCLKHALKMKSNNGFGGPEAWPSMVWFLNGLAKSAMAKWF
jgi:hypothetical protein